MEAYFAPLFSGSSGNATYIACGSTRLLVDAGVSCARITHEMTKIRQSPENLTAILLTHEHSDHIAGIDVLSRTYDLPVYATAGTWAKLSAKPLHIAAQNQRIIERDRDFYLGDVNVCPFPIPHDAADPVGYSFTLGPIKMAIATDVGHVQAGWMSAVEGANILLMEANYDENMLLSGPYPYPLKMRIRGARGHLSNRDAGIAAVQLAQKGVRHLILGHMSAHNNVPELAQAAVTQALCTSGLTPGTDVQLSLALRDRVGGLFRIVSA